MKLEPPKFFGIKKIEDFLSLAEFIFELENKQQKGFVLDLSRMKSISLIGQLLLYKFISYTAEKNCFYKPEICINKEQIQVFEKYGFYEIIKAYIYTPQKREQIIKSYKKIKFIHEDGLLIAPQRLLRIENEMKDELENKLFSSLNSFYSNSDAYTITSVCMGELLSNFWSHATKDSGTVMVAYCKKNYFEVCFADNGNGIISTLRDSSNSYKSFSDTDILKKSIEKGITSKPFSNHMGLGLFLIQNICKYNEGEMRIISEGCSLEIRNRRENLKKISFWRGTIVYLKLNLDKIVNLYEIPELKINNKHSILWG
jgi:anti-sigma regulatory factor (Ser/Thr protein kinase)